MVIVLVIILINIEREWRKLLKNWFKIKISVRILKERRRLERELKFLFFIFFVIFWIVDGISDKLIIVIIVLVIMGGKNLIILFKKFVVSMMKILLVIIVL